MPGGEVEEILALTLVLAVHVVGGLMLVWGVLDDEGRGSWRRWWRRGGGEDRPRDPRPTPPQAPARQPWPLPDADIGRVRLRGDGRVGAGYARPARRPEHPSRPAPSPSRRERH